MWKKLEQLIYGKEYDLKERLFRTIILISVVAAIAGIVECFLIMDADVITLPLLFLLVMMGTILYVTFKYRKTNLAALLLGIIIIGMVFPFMFFLSGGIEGGATIWFALGIIYIFIMFKGKRQMFLLALCLIVYAAVYMIAYHFPEVIVPMPYESAVYIDSFFSVLVVGIGAGLVFRNQMKVFEEEHKLSTEQKEELQQSSNAKNIFFANMSHEIRTPINTIIGLNEMILRENPAGETREYARDIQLASKMLLNQVNDVLDLSQMELRKMKIMPVKYETTALFGELVEMIRVQADKKNLDLYVDIDRNLPSVLMGDEKRLKQIFLNLLDNAVKYTQEGSVTMSARAEESNDGEIVLKVNVADTGIGIRKEDVDYIYDSFNRADEKKNARIVGSGLGLAITKQLIDLMEGEIKVDSIYTKGTVFTVILRQKVVDKEPIGEIDFLKRALGEGEYYLPSFEAPEARILVVDDNSMNTLVVSRLLSSTKVQVDVAGSGEECLEFTKKKYYHVILMDYMMPGMNGAETLKALRSQENGLCRNSAVIALTGNTMSGARQLYQTQGFDNYLEKPVQSKILEKEVMKFLPKDIIEYQIGERMEPEKVGQMQRLTMKKRKKIYITSDCTCDIPAELLDKYDIKLMYLYIKTPHGRFADTKEIDSDSFGQYLSTVSSSAFADSVTVEEYEEFFAETLTQAERVIHISVASCVGRTYNTAFTAARGFDHVLVIDSGQISGGEGLLALCAAKMAMEGKRVDEICRAVEDMKTRVQSKYIMPGADIFYQNSYTRAITAKVCRVFQLHPLVELKSRRVAIVGLFAGSIENAWKQGIRWHLRKKHKINKEIVFITHVGCSVKQQEWIKEEILKRVPFENVIIQKTSFSNACNTGMKTIGISYINL